MSSRLFKIFLTCFCIFAVLTLVALFSSSMHLGFFGYPAMLVCGTVFTTAGVAVGDAFRRFVKPDLILARDGVELFRQKVFWLIGPQVIGWLIGYMAYSGMMRNVLGFYI